MDVPKKTASRTTDAAVGWWHAVCAAYAKCKRVGVLAAVVIAVYTTLGCILFPDWWFGFFFGGELGRGGAAYIAGGLKALIEYHLPLTIGMILAVCLAVVLGSLFKVQLYRFRDKFAGLILFGCCLSVCVSAILVYRAEAELHDGTETILVDITRLERDIATANGPPSIRPPLDFHFMDKRRVDLLYNEIEPELVSPSGMVETPRLAGEE